MKKKLLIIVFIIIGLLILLVAYIFFRNPSKTTEVEYITDSDYLYDVAIDYFKNEYLQFQPEKDEKDDYQIFFDYTPFGISYDGYYKYAYMWIVDEAHYIEDGAVVTGPGSSMAYKVKFENDEVVDYEIPEDGSNYTNSIRDMFPDDIEDKVINYSFDDTELTKKVLQHYSYYKND